MTGEVVKHEGFDQAAVLRYLKLNPNDVATQAMLLICQRYGLDPLMKHVVLISGKPYVTRDGYLHIAHTSGHLDGIELLDEGANDDEWWAKVAVHRRDMKYPFTYRGRYPKSGQQKQYGPEMAVKTAEVMALRRAFDVTGIGAADEQWDEHIEPIEPVADEGTHTAIRQIIENLEPAEQQTLGEWWKANGLPSIKDADRLSASQAEIVLDHLDEIDRERPFEGDAA